MPRACLEIQAFHIQAFSLWVATPPPTSADVYNVAPTAEASIGSICGG